MPLYNVSETHHDHICVICGAAEQQRPHEKIERIEVSPGKVRLVIECANRHRECFNMALEVSHETDSRYSEEHRHQAQQIRALQRHLGLPLA